MSQFKEKHRVINNQCLQDTANIIKVLETLPDVTQLWSGKRCFICLSLFSKCSLAYLGRCWVQREHGRGNTRSGQEEPGLCLPGSRKAYSSVPWGNPGFAGEEFAWEAPFAQQSLPSPLLTAPPPLPAPQHTHTATLFLAFFAKSSWVRGWKRIPSLQWGGVILPAWVESQAWEGALHPLLTTDKQFRAGTLS